MTLPRADLEAAILNLLGTQNMCVLATTGPDGPLATPFCYVNLDWTILSTAQAGSPKLRDLAAERGKPLTESPAGPLVAIDPERVVYTDRWLRKAGFSPRQHWRRDATEPGPRR